MIVRFPPEVSALADRRDFDIPPPQEPAAGFSGRLVHMAGVAMLFAGATFVLAVVLFVPVLAVSLSRVEALQVAGELMSATVFADRLIALFWGSCMVALAVTSSIAGLRLSPPGPIIRSQPSEHRREDPKVRMTMLHLMESER